MKETRVLLAAWACCALNGHVSAAAPEAASRLATLPSVSAASALRSPSIPEAAQPAVPAAAGASELRAATLPLGNGVPGPAKTPQRQSRSNPDAVERKSREDMALLRRSHTLASCKFRFEQRADMVDLLSRHAREVCVGGEGLTIRVYARASMWAGPGASESWSENTSKTTRKPDEAKRLGCLQEQVQKRKTGLDEALAEREACEADAWAKYRQALKR